MDRPQICNHGHDTHICGRRPRDGQCRACVRMWSKHSYDKNRVAILADRASRKTPESVAKSKETSRQFRLDHPDREQASQFKYQQATKDRSLAKRLRRHYGLYVTEWEAMVDAQNDLCAICGNPETHGKYYGIPRLNIDHCHVTGQIRELLCFTCNGGIGMLKDSPERMRAAADYIEKHRTLADTAKKVPSGRIAGTPRKPKSTRKVGQFLTDAAKEILEGKKK